MKCVWCGGTDNEGADRLVPIDGGWWAHRETCLQLLAEGEALKATNNNKAA